MAGSSRARPVNDDQGDEPGGEARGPAAEEVLDDLEAALDREVRVLEGLAQLVVGLEDAGEAEQLVLDLVGRRPRRRAGRTWRRRRGSLRSLMSCAPDLVDVALDEVGLGGGVEAVGDDGLGGADGEPADLGLEALGHLARGAGLGVGRGPAAGLVGVGVGLGDQLVLEAGRGLVGLARRWARTRRRRWRCGCWSSARAASARWRACGRLGRAPSRCARCGRGPCSWPPAGPSTTGARRR